MTRAVEKWQGYFMRNNKFLLVSSLGPSPLMQGSYLLCGPFGTKLLYVVNKRRVCIAHVFISKQYIFAFPTRVSWLNIRFGIESKHGEFGNGPLSSCLNYVRSKPVIMIASRENKPSLGKGFLRSLLRLSWFGTSSAAWHFGSSRSNTMTRCFTKNVGMNSKLNTSFGMTPSCTMRWLGQGWWNMLRLAFLDQSSPSGGALY